MRKWTFQATLIFSVMLIILLVNTIAFSQSTSSFDFIFLHRDTGEFWLANTANQTQERLYTYQIQQGQILDWHFDVENGLLYVIDAAGCCGGITAGDSHIAQIEVASGSIEIIWEARNLVDIIPIPHAQNFMISFYDPALTRIRHERLQYCRFDLSEQLCEGADDFAPYDVMDWLDDTHYIGSIMESATSGQSFMIDIETGENRELPIFTPYTVYDSQINSLISSTGSHGYLSRLSLSTLEVTELNLSSDYDQRKIIQPIRLSSTGRYLVFQYEYSYKIADLETGEILTTFDNGMAFQWTSDERLMFLYSPNLGSYPVQLLLYSPIDETITQHLESDGAISFQVLN
jgi:hypothetical protein